jgi:hypothetical protein
MAFRVFTNSQQGAAFVLCLVTIPLCTIATALRVESTRRARRKIGLEDGFAMAALVFHLVFTTMFTWGEWMSRRIADEYHRTTRH